MTAITVGNLSPITHNHIPVITTELLAQLYCVEVNNIQQNHKRHTDRFVEGKHFYKAVGEELKCLRLTMSQLQISPKTRSLILWTERGAARHAKMLETDQAWEVFEKLEDCYFCQRLEVNAKPQPGKPGTEDPLSTALMNVRHLQEHAELAVDLWRKYVAPAKPPLLVDGLLLDMHCMSGLVAEDLAKMVQRSSLF